MAGRGRLLTFPLRWVSRWIMDGGRIRTPDQRLRVFVSSTLQELAEERAAVRKAVTGLRLSPVMFELGARPHPARELYRAYLSQSDVFIGIYWQSYGWVGPGEDVSGLEDEYRLSGGLPRLVYVKEPAPQREPNLAELLRQIKDQGCISYKRFESAEELAELVADDLALLLTEGFFRETPSATADAAGVARTATLPVPPTALVGRREALTRLQDLLLSPEANLVTLTGTGGTGKTRLALEAAHALAAEFADGVVFVPLASISDPALVPGSVASTLGLPPALSGDPRETLVGYLSSRRMLLVMDNFEQVVGAAGVVADLLAAAPALTILVTSRTPLRLRGEREVSLPPLDVPARGTAVDPTDAQARFPAVDLFIQRTRDSLPDFVLTADNTETVAEISRLLDGLPLALELAAARTRLLSPVALLERLKRSIDTIGGGLRDLPERQRTLRATIDWSYDLLDESGGRLFRRLAVFVGGWTLEAAEDICGFDGLDVFGGIEQLLDAGLIVRRDGPGSDPRFSMLRTVREFARERLEADGDEHDEIRLRHADWFLRLAEAADSGLRSSARGAWTERVEADFDNCRAALAWSTSLQGDPAAGVRLIWHLTWYWQARVAPDEGVEWIDRLHARMERGPDGASASIISSDLEANIEARLDTLAGGFSWMVGEFARGRAALEAALVRLDRQEDARGRGYALLYLGMTLGATGTDPEQAYQYHQEALSVLEDIGDRWGAAVAAYWIADTHLGRAEVDQARQATATSLAYFLESGDPWGIGIAYFEHAWIRAAEGDFAEARADMERAVRLLDEARDLWNRSWVVAGMGTMLLLAGDPAAAEAQFLRALTMWRDFRIQAVGMAALTGLAGSALVCSPCDGDHPEDLPRAARLLGAAARQRERMPLRPWPLAHRTVQAIETQGRALLGPDAWDAEYATGRDWPIETVLAYALREKDLP